MINEERRYRVGAPGFDIERTEIREAAAGRDY